MSQNGRLRASEVTTTYLYYPGTRNGRSLLKAAAPKAEAMATAFYLEFGKPLEATDGYRTYATQVQLKIQKGPYAATPGTSNHGWGKALDLASGVNSFSSREHKWLRANAHRWGFVHPTWAHDGYSGNGMDEAWHWEYVGGGTSKGRIMRPRGASVGLGHRGAKVREVQTLLGKAGYRVAVDGDYGLGTAIAVIKFQKSKRLKQDGKVGLLTRRALNGKRTPKKKAPAKHKAPKPGSRAFIDGRVKRVQNAVNATPDAIWGKDTSKRVAALKSASVYGGGRFPFTVEFAQRAVGVRPDGVWGINSARAHTAAVRRIQAVLGVKVDGMWGRETSGAVNALEAKARKK